ncbi:hypothetical protein BDV33DRAFT_186673 [Aspergillus novoparasiticus]|uniref:BTB domain-containing protein n=1 Tax=Aspergillus novoparasiticus TaxID=986946 RepID=A0A5N6FAG6_9EURO|nr:hypothetical protein BDV33DRAFT_186673 [Aspergillus novoparasiticus]
MDDLEYELDPRGDVFLVFNNVSQDLPNNLSDITKLSDWPEGFDNPSPPKSNQDESKKQAPSNEVGLTHATGFALRRSLQIRVSSKHLILACPQFERSLLNEFKEGITLRTTGYIHFPVQDWEAVPFLILMLIIHHRTRIVPEKVSFKRLAQIAQLVDYYECHEAVRLFSDLWLTNLGIKSGIPISMDMAEKCLFISWVFNEAPAFQVASKYLESMSTSMISFNQLPVPHLIQVAINRSRRKLITKIIESMNNLFSKLRDGPVQCSERCDCAQLGALVKGMHQIGILSLNISIACVKNEH